MKIYLMRHGITDLNKGGFVQGGLSDNHLCKEGIDQANEVKFFVNDLHISEVYTGSLIRQIETAKLVTQDYENLEYHVLEYFNEMKFGEFEAVHIDVAFPLIEKRTGLKIIDFHSHSPEYISNTIYKADSSDKCENYNIVADRVKEGFDIVVNNSKPDSTILIVSSGMAIGCFTTKHCKKLSNVSLLNCSVHEVFYDAGRYSVNCIYEGVGR